MKKTKQPLVSVIITTKNESKNIARLFKSIRNQTYNQVETIVVDNSSTDNTKSISKKYTQKVYDMGPERSAQRNHGAEHARGNYLLVLDADMELTSKVVEDCVNCVKNGKYKVLVIPERTVGEGLIPKVRRFEREMYMGDLSIEVARFFEKKVFKEFGGYDLNLTGPEDYDLPYRMSKRYKIGRANEYILHHEEDLTLKKLLKKKFYYASQGAYYAQKHPELIMKQGNLLFRTAYLKNWPKFVKDPITGCAFLSIRTAEMMWAIAGFVSKSGLKGLLKTLALMLKK